MRPKPMAEINLTPMIDVLLVLLILFMVAVPVAQRGLDAKIPAPPRESAEPTPQPSRLPVLEVASDRYKVGPEVFVSEDDLERGLAVLYATRNDRTLLVRAEGGVTYGRVVTAMDLARGAGVDRIGILPDTRE